MDLERVLYKKMTKDELIDKLIAQLHMNFFACKKKIRHE